MGEESPSFGRRRYYATLILVLVFLLPLVNTCSINITSTWRAQSCTTIFRPELSQADKYPKNCAKTDGVNQTD